MHSDSSKPQTRKILSTTLYQLETMLKAKEYFNHTYKNINFKYVCFVVRLIRKGDKCLFSDETGFFYYNFKRMNNIGQLKVGSYYKCICEFSRMDTTFKPEIINLKEADGNEITIHMSRVIKQEIQSNMFISNKDSQASQVLNQIDKSSDIYNRMKQWVKQKSSFTLQQIQIQFKKKNSENLFNSSFSKLEDQGIVGNMGDYYQFMD